MRRTTPRSSDNSPPPAKNPKIVAADNAQEETPKAEAEIEILSTKVNGKLVETDNELLDAIAEQLKKRQVELAMKAKEKKSKESLDDEEQSNESDVIPIESEERSSENKDDDEGTS
ncbi:unnamed protein product [Caenorhabditis bovis]|uniref:Uncharacterized protein n=1 Tax=Caenorhabditis bovis TaxID=2654633 RepID=A0A8S1EYQ3_9PELO|nr:unnamed protein product [Caenorhabditis bovis]